MRSLKSFLQESPLASRITLPVLVVLDRTTLTPEDASRIATDGTLPPAERGTCELEIGGQCVARGRVVRRGGKWFFKVTEMNDPASSRSGEPSGEGGSI